jgi:exopolyphosphatase / guanosine-5'-triphosphate,3'-diphosphate pyrophosphatase
MRVAVIDVGSNSIKLLVADGGPGEAPVEVASRTLEVRISQGLSADRPHLSIDGIERGIEAVMTLATEARVRGAEKIVAVATSAVRDASNGQEFHDRARTDADVQLRILTGDEEAGLIGLGLTTDPALKDLRDFTTFDLGGGSLECLSFRNREVQRALSLPLGCVRMTERFVTSPGSPLDEAEAACIRLHVRTALSEAEAPLPVPRGGAVIGTGGTLTTIRAIVAANDGVPIAQADPVISVALLRGVLASVGAADLAARRRIPGLSAERADVFPAALVTLLALADLGGFDAYRHSFRNLRWGVAAEMLG